MSIRTKPTPGWAITQEVLSTAEHTSSDGWKWWATGPGGTTRTGRNRKRLVARTRAWSACRRLNA